MSHSMYQDKLCPSVRHLLLANPALVTGGDFGKAVISLNGKARRAKNKGEIENLSIDEISAKCGLPKIRFVDEFDAWVALLHDRIAEDTLASLFYEQD